MKPITTDNVAHAQPSGLSCPSCQGVLFALPGQPAPRFRCRVGHAWSPRTLVAEQDDAVDHALWVALRALEEKAELNRRLAQEARRKGRAHSSAACWAQAKRAEADAAQIRELIHLLYGAGQGDPDSADEAAPQG
jgi:two-component system chemotaxis response regulator CheB